MQKTIIGTPTHPGDELLVRDLLLYEPSSAAHGEKYAVYPSLSIPRFIVPLSDGAALLFLITLISADRGFGGIVLRSLLRIPGTLRLMARLFAEPFVPAASHSATATGVSFVEKLRGFVSEHRAALPRSVGELRITKFCQRITGPDTKVLFLITDEHGALCIVKTMRSPAHNEKLKREKAASDTLSQAGVRCAPRAYFEGTIDGLYAYAEEVVPGVSLSKRQARRKVRDIIDIIRSFPSSGTISTKEVADILTRHAPEEDARFTSALERLRGRSIALRKGFTHSDLGRPNILLGRGGLRIIDWGRANELPLYLIDAVYFLVRLYDIRSAEEWREKGMPALAQTGTDRETAESLYDICVTTEILYKKYPERYRAVVARFALPAA